LLKLADYIDGLVAKIAHAVRWLAVAMVLMTVAIVILRYAFSVGAIALQESVMYMHGLLFLLGIPYGIRMGTHVRVDIFYAKQTASRQALINTLGDVLLTLAVRQFSLVAYLIRRIAGASCKVPARSVVFPLSFY